MYTRLDIRQMAFDQIGLVDNRSMGGSDPVRIVDAILRRAHEKVQERILALEDTLFIRHDRFTYEANALSVNVNAKLDTAANGRLHKIIACGRLIADADPSLTNMPTLIQPYTTYGTGGGPLIDAGAYGGLLPATGALVGYDLSFRLQNGSMWFSPVPQQDTYVYCEWVPILPFAADTDLCLGGQMECAEMAVMYEAAMGLALQKGPAFQDRFLLSKAGYDGEWVAVQDEVRRRPRDLGFLKSIHPDLRIARETPRY